MDSVKIVIWLHVSVAMVSTAMLTALGQHVKQDLQCLIVKNAERIVRLIQHGWVKITVVNVAVASFGCKK